MEEGTSKSPGHREGTEDDPRQWDTRSDCLVRDMLDRVSDKWSLLVMGYLEDGRQRFNELGRRVDGVSRRVLAATLRQLERDGLVERTAHPTVPPCVEYELTQLGATLHRTLRPLVRWAEEHEQDVIAARAAFDRRSGAA
ncbi:winged helix-turn-helix transcriptional regulator [Saccharothrix australiensis]|uniref:HxlR family transcriptional regulator n=1 Tax=Saccharothrix australiensis TaxID=2072 RepID=A0A495W7J7_9PSEU|nr:helix-turn-helix domain-containing protein [Saccharothrix australiensis]RKT57656.1 HxlR family transcriptional regulator [Saccharothrix australiensis]